MHWYDDMYWFYCWQKYNKQMSTFEFDLKVYAAPQFQRKPFRNYSYKYVIYVYIFFKL